MDGGVLSVPGNIILQADKYLGVDNNDRVLLKNGTVGGLWANTKNANIAINSTEDPGDAHFQVWANTNITNVGNPLGLFKVDKVGHVQCMTATGAFLPNRWTTTQRDAISSPIAGMLGYNLTTNKWEGYDGSWGELGGGSGGGSGATEFTGLSDVDETAKGALRIPYWNAAGTSLVGSDRYRIDPSSDIFYFGDYALDSAGELRVFNTLLNAYRSVKAANFLPGGDGNGLWRGPNDYYYPKNGSMHELKATHGFEFLHGSNKVLSLTSNGAILANATADPSAGDLTARTNVWVVDETNNTAQAFFKYSNGTTFKKLSTALALVDA